MEVMDAAIDRAPVIRLRGRLDGAGVERCQDEILRRIGDGRPHALLDLDAVEYIGGAGLRALILASRRAESLGIPFALCRISAPVAEALEIAGLLELAPVGAGLGTASG
jgi:anti-anti-sigma factor